MISDHRLHMTIDHHLHTTIDHRLHIEVQYRLNNRTLETIRHLLHTLLMLDNRTHIRNQQGTRLLIRPQQDNLLLHREETRSHIRHLLDNRIMQLISHPLPIM